MKNIKKFAVLILSLFLLMSCGSLIQNKSDTVTETKATDQFLFLVFNIHRDYNNSTNKVELVRKNEINGKMKTKNTNRGPNYLTLYIYTGKQLVDTVSIDHPLYKHYEYIGNNGEFKYKDTIIDNADFVIRTNSKSNEIEIFETLKDQPKKLISKKNF